MASTHSTWRTLERVLGKLQFGSIVDPVFKTLLKFTNRYWLRLATAKLRDVKHKIPLPLIRFLKKWVSTDLLSRKTNWRPSPVSLDIHTDASKDGWGFHTSDGRFGSGLWSLGFQGLHINILELATVFITLRSIKTTRGSHIRLHSDNSTTVHCINRMGSARSPVLNGWIVTLGVLLKRRRLHLSAFT